MSVEATTWAWKVTGLSPSEKLVLLCLADHSDRNGISWPSQKTIAEKTLLSRKTVNQTIARFIKSGLLVKEPLFTVAPFSQLFRYILVCTNKDTHVTYKAPPVTSGYNPLLREVTPPVTSGYTEPSLNHHMNRKIVLPTDFAVDQTIMDLALKNGWPDPNSEIEAFRDYHLARGSKFFDWRRAFHTWLRNARRFSGGNGSTKLAAGQQGYLSERSQRLLRRGL